VLSLNLLEWLMAGQKTLVGGRCFASTFTAFAILYFWFVKGLGGAAGLQTHGIDPKRFVDRSLIRPAKD
jgi:hypothetical protein